MINIRRTQLRRHLAGAGLTALALAVGFGLSPVARAQDDSVDPPTRVGRIAVIEGNVSFHPSPDDPWAAAAVNYPIAQAGQLWVEPGGRAEIGLGEARVRIDGGSEVDIVQFDDENVVLSVPQGRADIYLHGRHAEEHYIVETPRGNVDISQDGHYRFFAGSTDAPTRVAAFRGQAGIAEAQSQLTINHGEEAVISPTDPPSFQVSPAAQDPFDHWGEERERRVVEGVSYRYVSPDMPGAADLDQYGTWRDDPQYGHVWIPTAVEAGWAPYHNGHWASVAPWGWTWVDDAPWGFAPFHYGRWTAIGGGWGWVPGEVAVHPVYAPALVAWVGDPGALVGGGGVSVGWIPLGPREVWVPPYHTSLGYLRAGNAAYVSPAVINNITVNNITVIHNNTTFVNQQHVTVVSQQNFASAQPIQHAVLPVSAGAFSHPIAAAGSPAKVLPPASPAAHLGSPVHPASAPPAAPLPIAHPITPTNNLPKLAPPAAHPPGPATPTPGAPHPAYAVPQPATPHPVEPAAPLAHPPGPAATPPGPPHPGPATPTPAPAAVVPHPGPQPLPLTQPHPVEPTPPGHPAAPAPTAPQSQFHPPAPVTAPQPQVHAPTPPTPQPQFHPPAPVMTPQPQVHAPTPPAPQPQPQFHPPAPVSAPQPQVHAPTPPPAPQPQFHPPAPVAAPQPQVHAPTPPPQAPKPGTAPKKDDKDEHH
jgi:hypothetical protein